MLETAKWELLLQMPYSLNTSLKYLIVDKILGSFGGGAQHLLFDFFLMFCLQ